MTDYDDYGFFCDLENVKTMEYEEVEYYVVKVSAKYEVRKKHVGEKLVPPIEEPPDNDERVAYKKDMENVSNRQRISTRDYLCTVFSYLARIPRDIYYSLAICIETSNCVYLTITVSNNSIN
jgi:hypothetical protein